MRRFKFIFLLLFICGLAVTAGFAFRREPSLLEKATKITKAGNVHAWLSDNEILLLQLSSHEGRVQQVEKLNLTTQVRTHFPKAEAALQRFGTDYTCLPSPDGKWLLFTTYDEKTIVHTMNMETGEDRKWRLTDCGPSFGWLPGTATWVTKGAIPGNKPYGRDTLLYMGRVDSPGKVRTLPIQPPMEQGCAFSCRLVVTLDGRLFDYNWDDSSNEMTFSEYSLKANGVFKTKQQRFFFPPAIDWNESREGSFSLPGDHLAWATTENIAPPAPVRWLRRLLLQTSAPYPIRQLYVSRPDGSERRPIGSIEVAAEKDTPGINDLQWSPDGKKLSFIYDESLYVVPVDGAKTP